MKTCVLLKPQVPQTHDSSDLPARSGVGRDQLKCVMFRIDTTIKNKNAQRNERLEKRNAKSIFGFFRI